MESACVFLLVWFSWFQALGGGGQGAHLIHALWSLPTSCMLLPCQTRKWFLGARPWTPFWSKPCIVQHRRIDASPLWKKLNPKPKTFAIQCHQHVQPTFLYVLNVCFDMSSTCTSCNQHARQQIQNQRSQTRGFKKKGVNVRARPGQWWWNRQVTQVTGQVLATWFAGKSNMLIWIYLCFFSEEYGNFHVCKSELV